MKKTEITIEKLLQEGNYYKQIPFYVLFCVTGILFFCVGATFVDSMKKLLMLLIFVGIPFLIPFGYLLGLKKICETLAIIDKIKKGNIYILERQCIDKQVVSKEDTSNDTLILFEEEFGMWISRIKSKEIKVGDWCYIVYVEGDKEPSMVFNKDRHELEETLKRKIRRERVIA